MTHTPPHTVPHLVVGLGATGQSVVRYLQRTQQPFAVTDTRAQPPGLAALLASGMDPACWLGPLSGVDASAWARIVVSPGVSCALPVLQQAAAAGAEIIGDIELCVRATTTPIIGITGSNGKSTVTALVGALLAAAGRRVRIGGNYGTPALDLLLPEAPEPEILVLELSSFQLETTYSLRAASAAILNLSPDHLDRYPDLDSYRAAKLRILHAAQHTVLNRDDPQLNTLSASVWFGFDAPVRAQDFGLIEQAGQPWLARGQQALLPAHALGLQGRHHWLNAMAALALTAPWLGSVEAQTQATLREFTGLPHRSQWVAEVAGVTYINDSKGTNVGASLAAIRGVEGPLVLIAGGQGKGQDFHPLVDALVGKARGVVLIGEAAPLLAQVLHGAVPVAHAQSMFEAVALAAQWAQIGDTVLLSPACASQDQFADYRARGDAFATAVRERAS